MLESRQAARIQRPFASIEEPIRIATLEKE